MQKETRQEVKAVEKSQQFNGNNAMMWLSRVLIDEVIKKAAKDPFCPKQAGHTPSDGELVFPHEKSSRTLQDQPLGFQGSVPLSHCGPLSRQPQKIISMGGI